MYYEDNWGITYSETDNWTMTTTDIGIGAGYRFRSGPKFSIGLRYDLR
jgi:hypothetical protein